VQFGHSAVLQYSSTPSLPPATLRVAMRAGRVAGFEDEDDDEDDDEDENDAPGELCRDG
jgi:hypothetical protein